MALDLAVVWRVLVFDNERNEANLAHASAMNFSQAFAGAGAALSQPTAAETGEGNYIEI